MSCRPSLTQGPPLPPPQPPPGGVCNALLLLWLAGQQTHAPEPGVRAPCFPEARGGAGLAGRRHGPCPGSRSAGHDGAAGLVVALACSSGWDWALTPRGGKGSCKSRYPAFCLPDMLAAAMRPMVLCQAAACSEFLCSAASRGWDPFNAHSMPVILPPHSARTPPRTCNACVTGWTCSVHGMHRGCWTRPGGWVQGRLRFSQGWCRSVWRGCQLNSSDPCA